MSIATGARLSWPYLLAFLSCTWALMKFDWTSIGHNFRHFDFMQFLSIGVPLALGVLVLRSLRWMAVAQVPLRWSGFKKVFAYTALAVAAGTSSPMQLGELLKLKFARDESGGSYPQLAVAFALERIMDLTVLAVLATIGLGLHGSSCVAFSAAAVLLMAGIPLLHPMVRFLVRLNSPTYLARALRPLADFELSFGRLACLGLCTLAKWLLVALLWDAVFLSLEIDVPLSIVLVVVVGVTLSVSMSLVPGGLGVAEVSARAVLVWFGTDVAQAEAGAVGLRIISPLMIGLGLFFGSRILVIMKRSHKREPDERRCG